MTGSPRPKTMRFGLPMGGRFLSGSLHPKASDLPALEQKLASQSFGTLSVVQGSLAREGRYRTLVVACSACQSTMKVQADNLLSGKTKSCRCQRNRKYGGDPRAETLGERCDAMVQRCRRDTHVSSPRYKGRGILCLFPSREGFIRWALATWPDSDFKGLDFDRVDNNGHYEPGNLRLVSRSVNLKNKGYDAPVSTTC